MWGSGVAFGCSRHSYTKRILANWLKQHNVDQAIGQLPRSQNVYEGRFCALSAVCGKVRGRILELAARERDRSFHPSCQIMGAQDTLKLNGDAPFDWLRVDSRGIETRVEHKSASLSWDDSVMRWTALFQGIKVDQHDELQLSLFAPGAVFCFAQDESLWPIVGKKCGREGRSIRLVGPAGEFDVESALDKILAKVRALSSISSYPHDDPVFTWAAATWVSRTHEIYAARGCPFHSLNIRVRGMLFKAIARARDAERHPEYAVEDADVCFGDDGRQLHASIREYDWKRVHRRSGFQRRVEHKSAQITWDSSNKVWKTTWKGVRHGNYDELQLTVYSPGGLRTFIHDGVTGMTGRGSKRNVRFSGPRNEHDIDISSAAVLGKLVAAFGLPIMELI